MMSNKSYSGLQISIANAIVAFAKKMGAFLFIYLFASSAAMAYEIGTVCRESTQGWKRLDGVCDSEGYLQGKGVAKLHDLIVFGEFSKGLPNGVNYIEFSKYFDFNRHARDRIRSIELGESCRINFVNGQPADDVIQCHNVKAKSKTGNVKMAVNADSVVFNIGKADISGQYLFGRSNLLRYDRDPVNLTGSADSVTLERLYVTGQESNRFFIKNLNGVAAFPPVVRIGSRVDTTNSVKGVFDFDSGKVELRTIKATGQPITPVAEDFKYDIDAYGIKFKTAFTSSLGSVQYIKIENDLEFDGGGFELCLSKEYGKDAGLAKVSLREDMFRRGTYKLEFIPNCGKVTDRAGRSYSGFFDANGRPESR